jgi:L-lactate dehydrogenase (cytochrome)
MDPSVSWDDIAWLRANWNGPIIIKGIQRTEDAAVACEHGIDAISISNHGGRQLDHAPSPVSLLPEIADTVAGRCFVICDGGIRRGADVLKALALGANACSVGRAYLYGLGAAGEPGVDLAIGMLREEFRRAMALSGVRSLKEIDQSLVNWRKP